MKMRPFVAMAILALLPSVAGAQDFNWRGSVNQGQAIEIKGVNGDVRAEASGSNQVEVVATKSARRDDPATVTFDVVPHAGGVTICAVYPSREGQPNKCAPGKEGRMNTQNSDVTVRFVVRVPAGVTFIGKTVNGDVEATRLNGDVQLNTVNGSVVFSTTGLGRANTVNGSIRGEMGRADWRDALDMSTVNGSITLTFTQGLDTDLRASTVNGDINTDFPVATRRVTRRSLEGTIGGGGRSLSLETVNGSITLKRD